MKRVATLRRAVRFIVCGVVGAIAGLLMLAQAGFAADSLTLRLDWSFYGTHAPFFLGVEKGLYRAENIDLKIAEGNGAANVAKLIAQGDHPIGFIDYGTMVKGIAGGMPLKAIFGVHQRNPMVIISRAESPIKSPKELEGKVIAMAPAESTAQMYPVMLASAGVEAAKINVLNPAVGAKLALLLQKRTDAITGVLYYQPPILEAQGLQLSYFFYADYGVTALEGGIVANSDWLAKNGDLAKGFLRATAKAWQMTLADPGAAIDAAHKAKPELKRDRDVHTKQLKLSFDLLATANTKGMPLGKMSDRDWNAMIDVMVKTGGIKERLPLDKVFTNDHLPN